jgi:hypothetical protein
MPKHLAGKIAIDGNLATDAAPPSSMNADGRRSGHVQRSSVDPLAQTDHYRLVVPYTADPRRLGRPVRSTERAESI